MTAQAITRLLNLPSGFPWPGMERGLSHLDTMNEGNDLHYLAVGMSALACVEAALGGHTPGSILDLPCGFGRVTRLLRARYPRAHITVCDLDRLGVDFAASQFGATGIYSTPDLAELRLPMAFDLIWAGSLVTHLNEAQALGFIGSIARVMTRDATLVVSSHGPTIAEGLKAWFYGLELPQAVGVLDTYIARGYGHCGYGGGGGYGISLTDRDWWDVAAGRNGLEVTAYDVQAWDGHQDVVVLRRSSAGAAAMEQKAAGLAPARRQAVAHDGRMAQFDTAHYLQTYPDVAEALVRGDSISAYDHYKRKGQFEGRRPYPGKPRRTMVPFDVMFAEAWYLQRFGDVADAVARGELASGYDHWLQSGRAEGRPAHP